MMKQGILNLKPADMESMLADARLAAGTSRPGDEFWLFNDAGVTVLCERQRERERLKVSQAFISVLKQYVPANAFKSEGRWFITRKEGLGTVDVEVSEHAAALEVLALFATSVEEWREISASGQINVGTRLSFTVSGKEIEAVAAEVLFPGTDKEEIVYDTERNYYFITSMVLGGASSHKNVRFINSPAENHEQGNAPPPMPAP